MIPGTWEHKFHEDIMHLSRSLLYPQHGPAQGLAHTAFSIYTGRILVSESHHFLSKRAYDCSVPPAGLTAISWAGHQRPLPHLFCLCLQAVSLFHFPVWWVNLSNSGTPQMPPVLMLGFLTCYPLTTTLIIHSLLLWPTFWTDPTAVSVTLDCKGSFTTGSDLQNLSFLLGSKLPYLLTKAAFLYFQHLKDAACP